MLTRVPSVRLSGVLLMPQHKIVEAYLESAIPQKVSEDTKARLRAELECHIFDRADFYMEIGYDEETAFEKAIEQMGEGEEVKTELESLYKDSTLKGLLWFFGLCAGNLITISPWGYWHFVEPNMYASPSIAVLSVYLAVWVFLIVHTVTCFRQKLYKQLTGITSAVGLIAFGSIITNGILFPVLNSGRLIIRYITDGPDAESDIPIAFVTVALMAVYTVLCLIKLFSEDKLRKKPYRLSLKQITRFLSFISICFVVLYGFAYEKYLYNYFGNDAYKEDPRSNYITSITEEQRNLYVAIKGGDSKTETENMLAENGFVKQEKDYDPYWICDEYLENKLKKNVKGKDCSFFCYTNVADKEVEYDDVESCIIIAYDKNNKTDYKMFVSSIADTHFFGYNLSYSLGEETRKWFDSLQKGDDCEVALEFIRDTDAFIIEDESYSERGTVSTYKIELYCYCPLEANFIGFIFGVRPDDVNYSFEFEITAENGVIIDMKDYSSKAMY